MAQRKILFAFFVLSLSLLFFLEVRPSFFQDPAPVMVNIPRGSSTQQIAQMLQQKKILHSPGFFLMLTRMTGKSAGLKHGTYLMERNHYWKIIRKLELGLTYKVKVTIPEGWSSYQIGQRLESLGVISDREAFVQLVKKNKQEGMLFPETYFFEPNAALENVIHAMAQQFKKNYAEEFIRRANELKMTELQVVTLASIIEREAQSDSERPLISAVYHNRLKKKWLLEADPTVQYALSDGRFWKERLTYKDLALSSPYNTYRTPGLPPAPICNPGKKSIEAALYPADSKFLYFVADGKGAHYFFSDYKNHIQKKMELQRERKANRKF